MKEMQLEYYPSRESYRLWNKQESHWLNFLDIQKFKNVKIFSKTLSIADQKHLRAQGVIVYVL